MAKVSAAVVDTPLEEIPVIIESIAGKADEWKAVPIGDKISLLREVIRNARSNVDEWAHLGREARGVDGKDPLCGSGRGEVHLAGPATFGNYANGILRSLEWIDCGGSPPPPISARTVKGKAVVTVFPRGLLERVQASLMTGELVLAGPEPDQMSPDEFAVGGVAGILGAGNFDAPTELLCELFLKSRVCVYKPNPVCQRTSPVIRKIFEPLASRGYVGFIAGGGPIGGALVRHPRIDEIVLTGAIATYDKIVWGATPEEREANRSASTPEISTPVCAELGSVNPWIVVPGDGWTDGLIDAHARHLAFAAMVNNGHICASTQLIVVPRHWSRREQFLGRVEHWCARHPPSPPFYPGSEGTHERFRKLPNARVIKSQIDAYDGQQDMVLIPDVTRDGEARREALKNESFCHVLAELPVDSTTDGDPMGFLRAALDLCKEEVSGSLTMAISIDGATERSNKEEFDELIVDMPYGVVGINVWPGLVNSMPQLTWGAFPGHTREDIQSGMGYIGNAHLYKRPEKAVLRAPFFNIPPRLLVYSNSQAEKIFSRLADYYLRPGWWTLILLIFALLFGI